MVFKKLITKIKKIDAERKHYFLAGVIAVLVVVGWLTLTNPVTELLLFIAVALPFYFVYRYHQNQKDCTIKNEIQVVLEDFDEKLRYRASELLDYEPDLDKEQQFLRTVADTMRDIALRSKNLSDLLAGDKEYFYRLIQDYENKIWAEKNAEEIRKRYKIRFP